MANTPNEEKKEPQLQKCSCGKGTYYGNVNWICPACGKKNSLYSTPPSRQEFGDEIDRALYEASVASDFVLDGMFIDEARHRIRSLLLARDQRHCHCDFPLPSGVKNVGEHEGNYELCVHCGGRLWDEDADKYPNVLLSHNQRLLEIIEQIEKVNDSNGRYNACQELREAVKALIENTPTKD